MVRAYAAGHLEPELPDEGAHAVRHLDFVGVLAQRHGADVQEK